ncbi:MAG TPA: MBL fold metallo-hydrolase [Thermoanaerobaculia bacterium]|nr:MBL fold metallo-hydrolase [Thermoanaerobaculia bacterium]
MLTRRRGRWKPWTDAPPAAPPEDRVVAPRWRATFVNHATVLLQGAGVNVLTDPVWSERVSPVRFAGPRRHRPPGVRFEDLPPLDLVLVSHDHYDHFDFPTVRRIAQAHPSAFFATGRGNGRRLAALGARRAAELDWWESADPAPGLRVTAVPARHFSGRTLLRDRTLWAGFVVSNEAGSAYFAGDSGYGPHFAEIGARFHRIALAVLPIGAYRPRWFMQPMHISPAEAVRAAQDLGARAAIGVHFGTFELADDGEEEPLHELHDALAASAGAPPFRALGFGESWDVPTGRD